MLLGEAAPWRTNGFRREAKRSLPPDTARVPCAPYVGSGRSSFRSTISSARWSWLRSAHTFGDRSARLFVPGPQLWERLRYPEADQRALPRALYPVIRTCVGRGQAGEGRIAPPSGQAQTADDRLPPATLPPLPMLDHHVDGRAEEGRSRTRERCSRHDSGGRCGRSQTTREEDFDAPVRAAGGWVASKRAIGPSVSLSRAVCFDGASSRIPVRCRAPSGGADLSSLRSCAAAGAAR